MVCSHWPVLQGDLEHSLAAAEPVTPDWLMVQRIPVADRLCGQESRVLIGQDCESPPGADWSANQKPLGADWSSRQDFLHWDWPELRFPVC